MITPIQKLELEKISQKDSEPPSRLTNPFATCWTAPDKVTYVEFEQNSVSELIGRWNVLGGWGALVGQHGSGKTTLMHAVADRLSKQGRQVVWISLDKKRTHRLADIKQIDESAMRTSPVWLLEGFERLGFFARQQVLWQAYRRRVQLIATLHQETQRETMLGKWQLPTLAKLAPKEEDVKQMFDSIIAREANSLVEWSDAVHAWTLAGGNLREFWFKLYLLHEDRRRAAQNDQK